MTAQRLHLSAKERLRLFSLHGGICHICGEKIDGTREAWDVEHRVPWALTRDDSDENRQPAHRGASCHGQKTKADVAMIAKAKRQEQKFRGAKAPSKRPILGSRNTPFKSKIGGGTVRRDA